MSKTWFIWSANSKEIVIPKYEIEDKDPDNWMQGEEHDLTIKRLTEGFEGSLVLTLECNGGTIEDDEIIDDGSENWSYDFKVLPTSDKVEITVKSDDKDIEIEEDFAKEEIEEPTPELNTNDYDYVDMGEAGIWATCNVGAKMPDENGLYFAWGETDGYLVVNDGRSFTWDEYKFGTEGNISKYNNDDNLLTLEEQDDAAHVHMGGDWRMPTKEEFRLLYDMCNIEWSNNYGDIMAKGLIFKLKTDESKQLFLPACGTYGDGQFENMEIYGYYWMSNREEGWQSDANILAFNKNSTYWDNGGYRYFGRCVRGFIPKS